jgi:predicted nucleic acid-binding Zn ribbon protein
MPLKEYTCTGCKLATERLESSRCTAELPRCEKCGNHMELTLSSFGFRMFGQGVYKPSRRD